MNIPIRIHTFTTSFDNVLNRCFFVLTIFLVYLCDECLLQEERLENYLLCKYCGADVADLEYVLDIPSPASLKSEKQNFSGRVVLSQTFKNPSGIYFDVITLKKSSCIGVGKWEKADTWFPGFAWKICVCPTWGHLLGWIFEPFDNFQENQKKASDQGFYAFISDNILTEQFSNSLLIVPKSLKS